MNKKIFAVAGDRGGWSALEPELVTAADAGYEISAYFVGICEEQFAAEKLKPDERFLIQGSAIDAPRLEDFFKSPHALTVLGASQSIEGAQAAFLAAVSSSAPKLAVQDLYGSFIPTLALLRQAGQEKCVDRICVTDQFARDQILNEGYNLSEHVVVTGGPHFDKALALKKSLPQLRQKMRSALHVTDQAIICLIAGQLNGTDEVLALLLSAITSAGFSSQARLIIRSHPRATGSDRERTAEAAAKIPMGMLLDAGHDIAASTDDLLPAADFVLSGYSTTNTFGILYQMPGVIYMKTPLLQKDLLYEKNLDKPPEAVIGAAWYVTSAPELVEALTAVKKGKSKKLEQIMSIQKKISEANDGHATVRVWEQMRKLLEQS